MLWNRYWIQFGLSPRWQASTQVTNQWGRSPWKQRQLISHYDANLRLNSHWSIGAGLTVSFKNEWNEDYTEAFLLPEIRPFQQVLFSAESGQKWRFLGRVRFDERYIHNSNERDRLLPGYTYEGRTRFQGICTYRISGKWSSRVGDEVFVNYRKDEYDHHISQNRIFAGLNVDLARGLSLDGDFFFISRNDEGHPRLSNIFRLGLMQRIRSFEPKS